MKSIISICVLSLILWTAHVQAGEIREIEMTDGSIVAAEVLSLTNGTYTIKSGTLGTIRIEESKIRAIRSQTSGGSGARKDNMPGSAGDVRSLQEKMMNDKEIMSMIQSLADDPEFKNVLEDPEMMNAVNSGDIAKLTANPQFLKLLNNATVQDIQKKVK